jgi:hypothetical protein
VYIDGSAGREISEEEGDMRLTPSSTWVRLWVVSFSGVINFRLEQLMMTSFHVGGLVLQTEVVEQVNVDCTRFFVCGDDGKSPYSVIVKGLRAVKICAVSDDYAYSNTNN